MVGMVGMDEGYWSALLRDADDEDDPSHPAAELESLVVDSDGGGLPQGRGPRSSQTMRDFAPSPPLPGDSAGGGLRPLPPPWRGTLLAGDFSGGSPRRWTGSVGGHGDDEADWARAQALLASGETTTVQVTGFNRGGLLADFGAVPAFIPASHLLTPISAQTTEARDLALGERIGETLTVRVAEIDRDRCRLILSERLAHRDDRIESFLAAIQPGQIVEGRVTTLCPFGAFVDLGGFEGLIHISELSWGRINLPSDIVRMGDKVAVLVLEVDSASQKVALSLRRLRPDPWQGVAERYHPGLVVDATITNVVNFGAFARLEEGLEGLIHVSELAEGAFMHPRNVVREGDRVRACVLHVDALRRRVALTLRNTDAGARAGRADEEG